MVKCLIVDDEPLAIEIIETYLNKLEDFEIVAKCQNALQAFKVLEESSVDLIFLDIQMPQLTGIEFLKALSNKPKVIFTTAYIDYAVESYELDVLDYLVKPISFERFFKAINKYSKNLKKPDLNKDVANDSSLSKAYIYVRENKKNYKILYSSILYVESVKDYVRIHTHDKNVIVKSTLSDFQKELSQIQFLRVHRSYIVNLDHVTAHTSKDIEIESIEIPIGISYKQKVFEILK